MSQKELEEIQDKVMINIWLQQNKVTQCKEAYGQPLKTSLDDNIQITTK